MRNRITGLLIAVAAAVGIVATGATPAMAAEKSDRVEQVVFYNNGWYYAYADIEGFDEAGARVYSDFSGGLGHTGHKWFKVPAGVAKVVWKVRMEPFGTVIHEQDLGWSNFNEKFCGDKHATIYVGGIATNPDHYDMHCSNWGGKPPQ